MCIVLLLKRKRPQLSVFNPEVHIKLEVVEILFNYRFWLFFKYEKTNMKPALISSLGAELGTG